MKFVFCFLNCALLLQKIDHFQAINFCVMKFTWSSDQVILQCVLQINDMHLRTVLRFLVRNSALDFLVLLKHRGKWRRRRGVARALAGMHFLQPPSVIKRQGTFAAVANCLSWLKSQKLRKLGSAWGETATPV